MIGILIMA